ncbi:MAG: FG-GAP repeat protein [Polyangiales bacterium]
MRLEDSRFVALAGLVALAGCASETGNPEASHARRWTNAKGDFATVSATCSASAYLKGTHSAEETELGSVVAVSADGSMLAVGMPGESTDSVGVNPSPVAGPKLSAGAVTIFRCDAGTWSEEAFIKPSSVDDYDRFGTTVALSADGTLLAIGAIGESSAATSAGGNEADNSQDNAGAAYIFRRSAGAWVQEAYLKASNADSGDGFGGAISLSADGKTLAVGAWGEDGLDSNGVESDNSGTNAGAVYVFDHDDVLGWQQAAFLKSSLPHTWDYFGSSLALSPDGQTLAVGASQESSESDGVNSDQHDESTYGAGAVYLFRKGEDGDWWEESYIKASNSGDQHYFGQSVALSGDASVLVVGADGEPSASPGINGDELDTSAWSVGAVYVFRYTDLGWTQEAYMKASNPDGGDSFGHSVAVSTDGNVVVVGAPNESGDGTGFEGDQDDGSADMSGAVYSFVHGTTGWTQTHYIKANNTDENDIFGTSVTLSADGSLLFAGAPAEDSNATAVDGDGADNSALDSGACYAIALP